MLCPWGYVPAYLPYIGSMRYVVAALCVWLCAACQPAYKFSKKYAPQQLREDYRFMQRVLETRHPSLYWYTPKDSMDRVFAHYNAAITDSMNDVQFAWRIVAPTLQKIHCGHTTLLYSKAYTRMAKHLRLPSFPLHLRAWADTLAVLAPLRATDTAYKRGTIIKSINGWPAAALVQHMFNYLPRDGYNTTYGYNRLSANFPAYHRNIMGLSRKYAVVYADSAGTEHTDSLPLFVPRADSARAKKTAAAPRAPRLPRRERLKNLRYFRTDTSGQFAIADVNTFARGNLRGFYRRTFRQLQQQQIPNLILDIRNNGGGRIGLSTLLTKYISQAPFKVADSAFAVTQTISPFGWRTSGGFLNTLQLMFTTRRMADGRYHMRYFERKVYKPKHKNHYNGHVYVIVSGPTFSASSLFAAAVKGQQNVTLVGEETGGGWYGNNGILIPDVTMPHTRLRFRLPLFRLVQPNRPAVKGYGVLPDVAVPPTLPGIRARVDEKMQRARALILEKE